VKLSEWAHVAEVVGGVAIVASLIFVGLEVRENTSVARLTSDRAIDQQNLALNLAIAQSGDLAEILVRAVQDRDSLTEVELIRFDNYCFSQFGSYENIIGNFRADFITSEEYEIWTDLFNHRFNKPGYRQFWVEYRKVYFPEFRAWADEQFEIAAQ